MASHSNAFPWSSLGSPEYQADWCTANMISGLEVWVKESMWCSGISLITFDWLLFAWRLCPTSLSMVSMRILSNDILEFWKGGFRTRQAFNAHNDITREGQRHDLTRNQRRRHWNLHKRIPGYQERGATGHNRTIFMLMDVDSNIVRWVAFVFGVQKITVILSCQLNGH